jgi:hypothetical protein
MIPSGGELLGCEVILTPCWLLYLQKVGGNERISILLLGDLVVASRFDPLGPSAIGVARGGSAPPAWALLADRHGVRVPVGGTEAGVTRLLWEVHARAPWVLDRFDAEAQRRWDRDRAGIVAEADRRREDISRRRG